MWDACVRACMYWEKTEKEKVERPCDQGQTTVV